MRKNIKIVQRVDERIRGESIRKEQPDCARTIFRASGAQKPPPCAVTKRKMYRACRHRTLTRHWRNKRTGADDWPITRWPGYLRWYRLAIECPCSRDHQNASAPRVPSPFPSDSSFSDRVVRPSILCIIRSLVLTRPRPSPPCPTVCVGACVCPSVPRCPFSSLPRREIGFMTLFSSFADDVYQQIARRKRCFVLRRHNGRPGLAGPSVSRARRNRKHKP